MYFEGREKMGTQRTERRLDAVSTIYASIPIDVCEYRVGTPEDVLSRYLAMGWVISSGDRPGWLPIAGTATARDALFSKRVEPQRGREMRCSVNVWNLRGGASSSAAAQRKAC